MTSIVYEWSVEFSREFAEGGSGSHRVIVDASSPYVAIKLGREKAMEYYGVSARSLTLLSLQRGRRTQRRN